MVDRRRTRGEWTRQAYVLLLPRHEDTHLLPLHRHARCWAKLLELFLRCAVRQVVTIYNHLLACCLAEHGRLIFCASIAYPFTYSGIPPSFLGWVPVSCAYSSEANHHWNYYRMFITAGSRPLITSGFGSRRWKLLVKRMFITISWGCEPAAIRISRISKIRSKIAKKFDLIPRSQKSCDFHLEICALCGGGIRTWDLCSCA
jgi:hypothetical protein